MNSPARWRGLVSVVSIQMRNPKKSSDGCASDTNSPALRWIIQTEFVAAPAASPIQKAKSNKWRMHSNSAAEQSGLETFG